MRADAREAPIFSSAFLCAACASWRDLTREHAVLRRRFLRGARPFPPLYFCYTTSCATLAQ